MATNILTLTDVGTGNSGNYTVAITNSTGAVTSSITAVDVSLPPTLATGSGSPGALHLSGNTATDINYVVQSTTNLSSTVWIPVVTNNTGPTGAISFQTNTTSGPPKSSTGLRFRDIRPALVLAAKQIRPLRA